MNVDTIALTLSIAVLAFSIAVYVYMLRSGMRMRREYKASHAAHLERMEAYRQRDRDAIANPMLTLEGTSGVCTCDRCTAVGILTQRLHEDFGDGTDSCANTTREEEAQEVRSAFGAQATRDERIKTASVPTRRRGVELVPITMDTPEVDGFDWGEA